MIPVSSLTYNFHPQSDISNEQKDEHNVNLLKFVSYPSPSSILASENSAFTVVAKNNNLVNTDLHNVSNFLNDTKIININSNQNDLPNLINNTTPTNLLYNANILNNFQQKPKKIYKTKRIFKVFF